MDRHEIKPIIVGRLVFRSPDGTLHTPRTIYFGVGNYEDYILGKRNPTRGLAWARFFDPLRGTCLEEVRKVVTSTDGTEHEEPLVFEGFAGLSCKYNAQTGTIESFYE